MSYRPPRSFIKRLHELDPKLDCHFNSRIGLCVITYKRATGQPAPVWTVKGPNDSFRIPDQRDIDKLQEGDMTKHSLEKRLQKTSQYMQNVRDIREIKRREAIREMTVDDKYQLARAFSKIERPGGKGGRHVRQHTPKPRGKVF
jgi:hypothetical protein